MSPYKYLNASLPITNNTPKEDYRALFQETLDNSFYDATDWWEIQEETVFASEVYDDIDVRINHVINAETGIKLGDDWKSLLFKDVDHLTTPGRLYSFDDNIWITINTEFIKNLTGTCTVKRCNNYLRWIDETTGAYYSEPCSIGYMIKEPRDYSTAGSSVVTPSGFVQIYCQFNDRTNTIKPNQRFLFGNADNWTAYKMVGTGVNNFNNLETADNMSGGFMILEMVANYVNNETDDLVNGIADVTQNVYTVSIDQATVSGAIGDVIPLIARVTLNGESVTRTMTWTSSSPTVASVTTAGVITLLANGTTTITASVVDNSVTDTCAVTVAASPTPVKNVVISPTTNYVLEGDTGTYSVYLYNNGVIQADTFTITCTANAVPTTSFTFTQVDGNHFTLENILMCLTSHLDISCVSGTNTGAIVINLKGKW